MLDFLGLCGEADVAAIEEGMTPGMAQTLMEFGRGMASASRQVHREVDGDDFCVDLLLGYIPTDGDSPLKRGRVSKECKPLAIRRPAVAVHRALAAKQCGDGAGFAAIRGHHT